MLGKNDKVEYLRRITGTKVKFESLDAKDVDALFELFTTGLDSLVATVIDTKVEELTTMGQGIAKERIRERVQTLFPNLGFLFESEQERVGRAGAFL